MANSVPLTTGGLGVGEAALEQLFRLATAAGDAILIASFRVTVLLACAIGFSLFAAPLARASGETSGSGTVPGDP